MNKVYIFTFLTISVVVLSCKPKPVVVPKDPGPEYATIKDKSGNSYKTLRIGSQTWMVENLNTIRYSDEIKKNNIIISDSIRTLYPNDSSILHREALAKDNVSIYLDTLSYYWKYQGGTSTKDFGKLYTWFTIINRNVCPQGYRVPTESDWEKLINFLGGSEIAGGKMKSTDSSFWEQPSVGATNASYFNATGGGYKTEFANFINQLKFGFYWSATEDNKFKDCAISYAFHAGTIKSYKVSKSKKAALSVRCISNK
jgi:uncharacterized protein (TIGR02145 family)